MADTTHDDRDPAINPDHPERAGGDGAGGLLPGAYEQGNGEGGASGQTPVESVRGPGSRVPDPKAHPEQRERALDIAEGDEAGR